MSHGTRRVGHQKVLIDGILWRRALGKHEKPCVSCPEIIPAGEERYYPVISAQRKAMPAGRRSRMCLRCMATRLARAREAA